MSNRSFGVSPLLRHPGPSKEFRDNEQLRALDELGLLGPTDRSSVRREKGKDWLMGTSAPSLTLDAYPKKNKSVTAGTAARPPIDRPSTANYSIHSTDSRWTSDLKSRSGGGMSGMLETDRSRTRRERTFVGSECAVCEEPLEHTLRGERVLQFNCGHVSHGACFYEYMREFDSQYCPSCDAPLGLDTSRGGNVLDIEQLSSMVRSASVNETSSRSQPTPTPSTWENPAPRPISGESEARPMHGESNMSNMSNRSNNRESRDSRERYASSRNGHNRNNSEVTGTASSAGYPETTQSGPGRRHDYDVQAMETNLASPRASVTRNPIPPPTVTVRSEFPTLNRSRVLQTLTCLVTVEVPDNKWRPDPDDLREATPLPGPRTEDTYVGPPSPAHSTAKFIPYESAEILDEITENLRIRVENWHGLDFSRFGKLRLYGTLRVGKDKVSWQELECYLFAEMLICVKEKKIATPQWDDGTNHQPLTRCTLKGSILIKKHLIGVTQTGVGRQVGVTEKITNANLRPFEDNVLTLSLSVAELPSFHLQFDNLNQLKLWQQALLDLNAEDEVPMRTPDFDREASEPDEDDWRPKGMRPPSSYNSSTYAGRSATTAPTEYTSTPRQVRLPPAIHIPLDIVVVVPVSSSMQGVKISLVRDALKFMVQNLGDRDRMGLVTFGSSTGAMPLVGMTTKAWPGWTNVLAQVRPVGQKSHRADVVEGANVAMDLLMQRKSNNPIATILLISDSSTSETDSVDFVVSRAEAAKIAIHSFGLGMTHKPDTMIELSTRTKASYTYVKDWMMLRECVAGCLGALQGMSHQNVKLKLKLPEGSPAKFVKISGALQITKRATGRDAEACLGDLRFGDKRDILVQLAISPDNSTAEQLPQDPWESIVSGLEALSGNLDQEDQRVASVEEVPLIQADLSWGDLLKDGSLTHLPRPSLLAITMLGSTAQQQKKSTWQSPPIPPLPSIVQRRMELLTSDMLTRALTLISKGQHDRAHHLLTETRTILKGLGKGGLPPIPPPGQKITNSTSPTTNTSPISATPTSATERRRTPSPTSSQPNSAHPSTNGAIPRSISIDNLSNGGFAVAPGIDTVTVAALDAELESSLEWINHPAVFGRDSRKAVLQAIGVISSQRGYTFRTPVESLWAGRVPGITRLTERSKEWREEGGGEGGIMEEA